MLFTPGTVVSNALSPANSTVFYQFTGTAGEQVSFDALMTSGFIYQPYVRLFAPAGNIIMATFLYNNVDTFPLPQAGIYTLAVEGRVYDGGASGNYAFNLLPVTYPTNALTIGATVSGTVSTLGQRQFYTFTLGAAGTDHGLDRFRQRGRRGYRQSVIGVARGQLHPDGRREQLCCHR